MVATLRGAAGILRQERLGLVGGNRVRRPFRGHTHQYAHDYSHRMARAGSSAAARLPGTSAASAHNAVVSSTTPIVIMIGTSRSITQPSTFGIVLLIQRIPTRVP